MKKLTALFLAIAGAMLFLLAGCANNDDFTEKTYQSGDDPVEQIVIEVTDRALEFSVSEDDRVHIDYFDSDKEYLDIDLSDNRLIVRLEFDKDWTDFIGIKPSETYRKIQVRVPSDMITDLTASTTNENITVTSLSFAGSVTLDSNGGNILCERVGVGKAIGLTAKNGNISGTILGGWDDFSISCTIKKGECNLTDKEGGVKSLTADCNNGNINIAFVQ